MAPAADLLAFCERHADWTAELVETLVRLESPTTDKAAVDRCGRELDARLTAHGARVTRLSRAEAGDHLLAELGCGVDQILVLGHFDTVWPVGQLARMPLVRRDGRLFGPGTFDMKAGIAIAVTAARALYETGNPPAARVVMLWTTDEETGSATSRAAIEDEARRSKAVLVFEPALSGGALKTSRKGCGEFKVIVRGVAAHAGIDPGKGASAVHELARQITAIERLQDLARGISVNVGIINGGTRANVVAEEARAVVDVRVPTMTEAARVEAAMRGLRPHDARTSIGVSGGVGRPPLERSAGVVRLFELAKVAAAELGDVLEEGGTGGGSDGNFTAALGVPTLDGLGAVGAGAHALDEHVELAALPRRAALAADLIRRVAEANI